MEWFGNCRYNSCKVKVVRLVDDGKDQYRRGIKKQIYRSCEPLFREYYKKTTIAFHSLYKYCVFYKQGIAKSWRIGLFVLAIWGKNLTIEKNKTSLEVRHKMQEFRFFFITLVHRSKKLSIWLVNIFLMLGNLIKINGSTVVWGQKVDPCHGIISDPRFILRVEANVWSNSWWRHQSMDCIFPQQFPFSG